MSAVDLTEMARAEIVHYISHIHGFIGEALVKKLVERYISSLYSRGYCVVARGEFCLRSLRVIVEELSFGGLLRRRIQRRLSPSLRFEAARLSEGIMLPASLKISECRSLQSYLGGNREASLCIEPGLLRKYLNGEIEALIVKKSKLLRDLLKRKPCIVSDPVFEGLLRELSCIARCYSRASGKKCFDFFIAHSSSGSTLEALLVEVKTSSSEAMRLESTRKYCLRVCKPIIVGVAVVDMSLTMPVLEASAKIYGDASWLTSFKGGELD